MRNFFKLDQELSNYILFVNLKSPTSVIPLWRGMKSLDPPGMSSKILSSGFSNIFIGKGHDLYHR